jgi:hypothetical protein
LRVVLHREHFTLSIEFWLWMGNLILFID